MYYRNGSGARRSATSPAAASSAISSRTSTRGTASAPIAVIEAAGGQVNDVLADDGLTKGNVIIAGPAALYDRLEGLLN